MVTIRPYTVWHAGMAPSVFTERLRKVDIKIVDREIVREGGAGRKATPNPFLPTIATLDDGKTRELTFKPGDKPGLAVNHLRAAAASIGRSVTMKLHDGWKETAKGNVDWNTVIGLDFKLREKITRTRKDAVETATETVKAKGRKS